jgi:hypothetical protein
MRSSVTRSRCSFFTLSDTSIFMHFDTIDDVGKHWLQFLVGGIKEAVIISIIIAVARCLHAGQSFLYFGGGHVEDALTCLVRVVVGTMDEANIMQTQPQSSDDDKGQNARMRQHQQGRLTIRILDVEDGRSPLSNKSTNDFNMALGNV